MIKAFDGIFQWNKMTLREILFEWFMFFNFFCPTALQVNNAIHQSRSAVLKCSDASTWQNSTCLHGCIASLLAWTSGNLSPNKTDCYFRLIVCNDHFKEICLLWSCFFPRNMIIELWFQGWVGLYQFCLSKIFFQVLKGDLKKAIETHQMLYEVSKKHTFLPEVHMHAQTKI